MALRVNPGKVGFHHPRYEALPRNTRQSPTKKSMDGFVRGGVGKSQLKSDLAAAHAAQPPALGLQSDPDKGTVKGLLKPFTGATGQQVIDFNGIQLPVPTGGKPEALPVSDNQVVTLTPRADGLVEVNTRTVGLESDKKGNKFKGTLLADDNGKLDIGGKEIDVAGMKPGKTKTKTIKIKGKKYKVKVRMNADGTFHVEGKRKRGLFGSIANFVGGVLNKVMPVLSVVSMAIPGMQWLGAAAKVWGAIQGGIGAVKSFASGNILGGLASLAGAVAGGAKALGAKAFASVAEKVSQTLSWVQTGFNTLKNGFKALGSGDILGGLAGIASTLAGGAGVVGKWATGAVQATAEKLGGLFGKISGSLSAVKDGLNVFKNGLSALKNGDLLGGLASIASSLAGGARVVGGWAQGQVQKVATEIGSVLGKVANTLGLGKAALQGVKAGLAALGTGRLAEGVSLVFGALATGATAASDWTRGQASKAVENLSKLFSNVSAGAAQVQGLMDAVKSRNPSAILQALAGALGFSAGVVNQGAGKTAELLQNISAWLGRAGNIAADPKGGLVNLLKELGPDLLKQLFSAGDPKPAVAGAGTLGPVVSDMDPYGLGGGGGLGRIAPGQQVLVAGIDWNKLLDFGQIALDILGWVPGPGEIADLTNAGISAARGNYLEAGLSLLSLVPGAGDAIGKGAKAALKSRNPQAAKEMLDMMRKVDFATMFKKLSSNPHVAKYVGVLQRALDKVADELARLAGVQKPNFAMVGGGSVSSGRPTGGGGGKKVRPNITSPSSIPALSATTPHNVRGAAVRAVSDGWARSAKYTRASDLNVLVPGSKAWNAAVRELRKGGPEAINNIRVKNASEAKKLLLQAFPANKPGALNHARTHLNDAPGTYQFHPPDLKDVNDLSHIKWTSPNGGGHIWFGNPGNSGSSIHYVSQRDFDRLMTNEGFTREELEAFGVRPGGNRIGPGGRDLIDSGYVRPGNRPGN